MAAKIGLVPKAKSAREALERLKGTAVVIRRRTPKRPVRPIAVPGLEQALREARGDH